MTYQLRARGCAVRVKRTAFSSLVCLAAMATLCSAWGAEWRVAAIKAALGGTPSQVEWNLRDRYTFGTEQGALIYGVDNGEWYIDAKNGKRAVNGVAAEITLANGTTIRTLDLGFGTAQRDAVTTELGEGMEYAVELPVRDGLKVKHSLTVLDDHPFYMIRVRVTNASAEPVAVKAVRPVIIGRDGLPGFGADAEVRVRKLEARGPCVVIGEDRAMLVSVRDPGTGLLFALAPLPLDGTAQSQASILDRDGVRCAEAGSEYEPARVLHPGETLNADPALICFTVPDDALLRQYHGYAYSLLERFAGSGPRPRCWVTVEDWQASKDLAQATRTWWDAGVRNVLIPSTWESEPGSLTGAYPFYPKNMSKQASIILKAGMAPGITVTPLVVKGGDADWIVTGDDGRRWLNPRSKEARAYGVRQMHKVAEWGFVFFVIADTPMPGDVRKTFGVTQAEADAAAFAIMAEAAEQMCVLPGSAATIPADAAAWQQAAETTSNLFKYGVTTGPVRFNASGVEALDKATVDAILSYAGPVEFVGEPTGKAKGQLKGMY